MTPEEHAARAMWMAESAEFLSRSIQRSEAGWAEVVGDVKAKYIRLASAGVAAAIAAEREACATIADRDHLTINGLTHGAWDRGYNAGRMAVARDIRARGDLP